MEILTALRQEEAKLQSQLTGIRAAITALGGGYSAPSVAVRNGRGGKPKRVVSAALRAHLSRKAKERWAKVRAEKGKK
jgi:hypothetical protein